MKHILLIFLIVFFSLTTLTAQDFWEVLPTPDGFHGRSSATNSMGWLFIGTNDGVYRSIENGNNLEKIGLQNTITALTIDTNDHILAGSGILYHSDNFGVTWQEIATPEFLNEIYFKDSLILFGNWGKIFKSTDFGDTWVKTLEIDNTHLFTSFIKTSNGTLLAGEIGFMGGGGIYQSTKDGDSWEFSGLYDEYISSLAINSEGVIFAGSRGNQIEGGGGVFKSEDNGNTWTELTDAIWVTSMVIDTNDIIYVGAEINSGQGGVFRSVDNGITWERIISGMGQYPSVEGMCLSPDGYLYAYDSKLYRSIKPIYTSVKKEKEKIIDKQIIINPNPCTDLINFKISNQSSEDALVTIVDMTGRKLIERKVVLVSGENTMDISALHPGIYSLNVLADKANCSALFVKQ